MTDTAARQRQLIGSTAAWAANNIVLGNGEIGIEVVSSSDVRMKVGDGTSTFSALPYASASSTTINTATQAALDAKLALAGGTMTGLLVLSGNPSAALGAATKQYVDAADSSLTTSLSGKLDKSGGTMTGALTLSGAPSSSLHAATKTYVDTADALKVSKSGDTMTGALVLPADPTSALEAATKQYVDGGAYQTVVGGSSTYAGKVVKLNSSGQIDTSVLPSGATYLGSVDMTAAYGLSAATTGSYYTVQTSGTIAGTWSTHLNGSPTTCGAGQFLYQNANGKWDLVGDTTISTSLSGKLDKSGGTMTGALILAADPSTALGAATKQYADTMLPKAGGTMTGAITLAADPTSALHAATKQYVDAAGSTLTTAYQAADSSLSSTLTTSINGKLSLSGGTMTGTLVLAGAPTSGLHAATKTYVDTADALAALRANNLSDLASASTARTNLGLGSVALLNSVSYANIQNISATSRVLGRRSAGAGVTEELTLSQLLDFVGSAAQGDILYRGSAGWERLAAGTSGQVLKTNGAGANPSWTNAAAGATLLASGGFGTAATKTISLGSLTSYRRLVISIQGVSASAGSTAQYLMLDGLRCTSVLGNANTSTLTGVIYLDLISGAYTGGGANSNPGVNYITANVSSYSTSSTSIVFSWEQAGNFDAGTYTIYGEP